MRRTINVFTSLIFIYSLVVCITCKQVSPEKVGNLEFQMLTMEQAQALPVIETKKEAHFQKKTASAVIVSGLGAE